MVKVLLASSEVVPFAKTGGLADVCGTLPRELAALGHEVAVIMPAFRSTRRAGLPLSSTGIDFDIPVGVKIVSGRLLESRLPGTDVPIYFVEQTDYFDRRELYREHGEDYRDNCERFAFFSRAVLESVRLLELPVDLVHCNDWQTGLIPAYLAIDYRNTPGYEQIASLMTIHNLAYQGVFWHWDMLLTGLDWRYFNWHQMEFYGKLNLLKTGIVFADSVNTVSPTYAREIMTCEQGCGLEGVLQQRAEVLSGIMNGVDYDVWNPLRDTHLPVRYGVHDWESGKSLCKAKLQDQLGLDRSPRTPLVGLVGRLAAQKGWDLVAQVLQRWAGSEDVQWAILGTGEAEYERQLTRLAAAYPRQVALRLEFSDELAHRIEAAADLFLMPSAYEPCGLNQLYSLKYGAVPLVRRTGGLADSVEDADDPDRQDGNGFTFLDYSAGELDATLRRAVEIFRNDPSRWRGIVERGMRQDWSWQRSARQYVELYESTVNRHRDTLRGSACT